MRRVIIGLVALLAFAGSSAPAGAATGWSLLPAPASAKEPNDSLAGISCSGAGACLAVGTSGPISGKQQPLAEVWNGATWTVTSPAKLTKGGLLDAVACVSATSCLAVGNTYDSLGAALPLAEAWSGTSWTAQTVPVPAGATSITLAAVACAAQGACEAVGSYTDSTGTPVPLAESWNGTAWTVQATPAPAGASNSSLAGIWCTSASACEAVGNSQTSSGTTSVLAETWNGTSWSIQTTPDPSTNSSLSGVTCPAATDCIAVGASAGSTLVESWNGTSWSVVSSPSPNSTALLTSLACTSGSACTAVGTSEGTNGVTTLAEAWNGATWTVQTTPNPANYGPLLPITFAAVACTSASACTAVGGYANVSAAQVNLGETWNGSQWALTSLPEATYPEATTVSAVTCTSATACLAVGSARTEANGLSQPVAETWNGTKWTAKGLPGQGTLTSISCSAASSCTAVGISPTELSGVGALADQLNGATWTQQSLVNPSAFGFVLDGVACPSATECIAVGYTYDSTGNQVGLAEAWNGTAWTVQSLPSGSYDLSGIACSGPSACTAVGDSTSATLAEGWNGSAWSQQSIPNDGFMAAVACPGSSECLVAGAGPGSKLAPGAEEWNGTTWAIQTVPDPTGGGKFSALACPAASACTAVGGTGASGAKAPLAEAWNGAAWALQTIPAPSGAAASQLTGLSCPSATTCVAVGSGTSTKGKSTPLAETYSG